MWYIKILQGPERVKQHLTNLEPDPSKNRYHGPDPKQNFATEFNSWASHHIHCFDFGCPRVSTPSPIGPDGFGATWRTVGLSSNAVGVFDSIARSVKMFSKPHKDVTQGKMRKNTSYDEKVRCKKNNQTKHPWKKMPWVKTSFRKI